MFVTPETAKNTLPEGHHVRVAHYHEGNDPTGKTRRAVMNDIRDHTGYNGHKPIDKPKYVSLAWVIRDGESADEKVIAATGFAVCSEDDTPCRRLGWEIAASRAIGRFMKNSA